MKVGDIVELIDESVDDWNWKGRMTVIDILRNGQSALCVHPDMGDETFNVDSLVVMEEADEHVQT